MKHEMLRCLFKKKKGRNRLVYASVFQCDIATENHLHNEHKRCTCPFLKCHNNL